MKRFTVPCDFGGQKHPFHVYIGEPHPKKHPLQFQAWWLSTERGGTIPQDVMDSFEKLFKISQENNVSFEDLCVYALGTASEEEEGAQAGGPMDTPGMEEPSEGGEAPMDAQMQEGDYNPPMVEEEWAAPQPAAPEPEYGFPEAHASEEIPAPAAMHEEQYAAPMESSVMEEVPMPATPQGMPQPEHAATEMQDIPAPAPMEPLAMEEVPMPPAPESISGGNNE